MNVDELADAIRKVSSEEVVQKLSRFMVEWKNNDETAEDLKERIERYIGNTWIERNEDHKKVYQLWASFRDEAISGIGGMTMNERLYQFGLFERFDACPDREAQVAIYKKVHAKP
jgi:hypothetical protein